MPPPASPNRPGRWTPQEMMRVRQVGDVHVAPDGGRVLYTATTAMMGGPGAYYHHIHLASVDGSGSVHLNPGESLTPGESSATHPQWSPDGQWVSFVSDRNGNRDLYLLALAGGEAVQLTATANGIGIYKWSPDGRHIAFTMLDSVGDHEASGTDARVIGAGILMNHLWVVSVDPTAGTTPAPRRLTQGDFNVAQDFAETLDWSPDGRTIAFTHTTAPQQGNRWPVYGDISTVDLASGAIDALVESEATSFGPVYSPNGEWLAYAHIERPTWPGIGDLFVMPASGGEGRRLHATLDRKPLLLGWSADGDRIYYIDTLRTFSRVGALPVDGSGPIDLGPQDRVLASAFLNHTRTHIGCVFEDLQSPPEAFVLELKPAACSQISGVNNALPDHPLGRTELITWGGVAGGAEIEGLLTYPVDYEPGRVCPLVVDLHGGPHWFFSQVFIANPQPYQFPLAAFAASGFAVLRCNIRGSGGYGTTFRFEVMKDLGGVDFDDVMAGVNHVIDIGVADSERLGVLGWSYGAYLSAWAITQTRRFKAACMLAPVTNLVSFTGTTDNHELFPGYLETEFWDDPELFLARSPIMHVKGVTTPTLLLHGEADTRVPIAQSFEFHDALRQQGCQVQMVAYPRMQHAPAEPEQHLDLMERTLAWFNRLL